MGLKNKFAQDDPYVLFQQVTAVNGNQASFNTTLAEKDHLSGSSAYLSAQAINIQQANPHPVAYTSAQNAVGAAIGNVGQEGTYSEEPDGGGNPVLHEEYPQQTRLA